MKSTDLSCPRIHVVSLQVPFPPDYGGVVDIYYKIKALEEAGYEIVLHTFRYGREPSGELEKITAGVFYYPRHCSLLRQFSRRPYIVSSRRSSKLLKDLLSDDAPILFEGLHCCALLPHKRLKNRIKLVRAHNVEHEYYRELARKASRWKRFYYRLEAFRLERYEKVLRKADAVLAITESDQDYFSRKYPQVPVLLFPAFHAQTAVAPLVPKENYVLYHGNLSVEENIEAAEYLLRQVLPLTCGTPWIFAGKNPPQKLVRQIEEVKGACIIANPTDGQLESLIEKAAANVLVTFQPTGLKLKLLKALFCGGHCIVNRLMLSGTGLEKACIVADTPRDMANAVLKAVREPFGQEARTERIRQLARYDNRENVDKLTDFLKEQHHDPKRSWLGN